MAQVEGGVFGALGEQPADPLLALIAAYRDDPRTDKIDLGVGVYRDAAGNTPVMRAVKAAEKRLAERQETKAYLGSEGDMGFVRHVAGLALGPVDEAGFAGVQTPGGSGALRLAAELIAAARPQAKVWVGTPTWPNHGPIAKSAGLHVETYPYFDATTQTLLFDRVMEAAGRAIAGDVFLLHGCCHNPTGADLSADQWREVADLLAARGVLPLLDTAYQGLGRGMEQDAEGVRIVAARVPELLLAYSCNKNFALYRERTGALAVLTSPARARAVQSNLLALARTNWSMPPDHGAAIVRTILEDRELRADWAAELDAMRDRLRSVRHALARELPAIGAVAEQSGLFALLPVTNAVGKLKDEHGIYMAPSGRVNLAGLNEKTVPVLARALAPHLPG